MLFRHFLDLDSLTLPRAERSSQARCLRYSGRHLACSAGDPEPGPQLAQVKRPGPQSAEELELFFSPLVTANEERSFSVSGLSHSGQSIRPGDRKTIFSNRCPHCRQEYSKIGILSIIALVFENRVRHLAIQSPASGRFSGCNRKRGLLCFESRVRGSRHPRRQSGPHRHPLVATGPFGAVPFPTGSIRTRAGFPSRVHFCSRSQRSALCQGHQRAVSLQSQCAAGGSNSRALAEWSEYRENAPARDSDRYIA